MGQWSLRSLVNRLHIQFYCIGCGEVSGIGSCTPLAAKNVLIANLA